MCSWKWARPRSSSRSSAEPARAQSWNSATGRGVGLVQHDREPVRELLAIDRALAHDWSSVPSCAASCRAKPVATGSGDSLARWRDARRLPARAVLRAGLPVLRLSPWSRRARSAARPSSATWPRCAPSSPRGAATSRGRRLATRLLRRRHALAALAARASRELLDAVRGAFAGEPAEVTLEVNPSTLERERLPGVPRRGRRPRVARHPVVRRHHAATARPRAPRARGRAHARRVPRRRLRAPLARPDRRRAGPGPRGVRPRARRPRSPRRPTTSRCTSSRSSPARRSRARRSAAASRSPTRRPRRACSSAPRSASSRRATGATRSRAMRGPAARRSTTSATGSAAPCSASGMGAVSNDPPAHGSPARRAAHEPARARRLSRGRRRARGAPRWRCSTPRAARGEAVFLALRTARGSTRRASRPSSARRRARSSATRSRRCCAQGLLEEADTGRLRLTPRGRMLVRLASSRTSSDPDACVNLAPCRDTDR